MKDRFHASRLDTSSVLSDTTVTWLTTAGSARAGDKIHNDAKSATEIRRFLTILPVGFLPIGVPDDEIPPPPEEEGPRRQINPGHFPPPSPPPQTSSTWPA